MIFHIQIIVLVFVYFHFMTLHLFSFQCFSSLFHSLFVQVTHIQICCFFFTETNAFMKRIDLCCKILAPVLVGQIMTYVSQIAGVIFIASWNAVSVFLEYYLLWKVYVSVPALSHKVPRKDNSETGLQAVPGPSGENRARDSEEQEMAHAGSAEALMQESEDVVQVVAPPSNSIIARLTNKISTFRTGWRVYMRQSVARPGICLAMFYFTVLDYGNIATGYAYTQHLSESLLSILRGAGAVFGISATFLYPRLRRRVGLVRTGLFSTSYQVGCMAICLVAVFASGSPFFVLQPNFGQLKTTDSLKLSTVCMSASSIVNRPNFNSSAHARVARLLDVGNQARTNATPSLPSAPSGVKTGSTVQHSHTVAASAEGISSTLGIISASKTILPFSSGCYNTTAAPATTAKHSYLSIALLLTGITLYRLGLWMSDLTITQFQQENVPAEERGIVGGMQHSFNSFANLLIIILVIVLHTPREYGLLAILSVSMVALAGLLYASFAYKERGHLFHFDRLKNLSLCASNGATAGHADEWQPLSDHEQEQPVRGESGENGDTTSVRNENFAC